MKLPNFITNTRSKVEDYFSKGIRSEFEDFKKTSMGVSKTFTNTPNPTLRNFNVDPSTIQAFSFEDNYVRAIINKWVDKIMAGGYIIEPDLDSPNVGDAERQEQEFKLWEPIAGGSVPVEGENINFNRVLKKTCISMIKGDDHYWELVLPQNEEGRPIIEERPRAIHVLDWDEMSIRHDAHGNLIDLEINPHTGKRVNAPFVQSRGGLDLAFWDKFEIIHGNYYGEGSSRYGVSLIRSILFAAATKRKAELFSSSVFEKSKPRGMWELGMDDIEYEKGKQQILESAGKPQQDIFVQAAGRTSEEGPAVKYSNLVTPKDLEFGDTIGATHSDIWVGMGMTPRGIYAPAKTTGWDAEVELHELDESVNAKRDYLERFVNNQLFERMGWDAIRLTFSKANKRDEEREAKISRLISDVASINERRTKLGMPEIEGGDTIIPSQSSTPTGDSGSEPKEEKAASMATSMPNHVLYTEDISVKQQPGYFRKTFSSDGRLGNIPLSKTDTRTNKLSIKPPIGDQQKVTFDKIFKLRNDYKRVINKSVELFLKDIVTNVVSRVEDFQKIKDPEDILKAIDESLTATVPRVTIALNSVINEGYNFGSDRAGIQTSVTLAKNTPVDTSALEILDKHNINVVEGAFSEMAARSRTAIRQGIIEGESTKQIAQRIKGMTKGSVERVYKNRFENIARTEVNRAVTNGHLNGYEKSGVVNEVEALIGADPDGQCTKNLQGKTFTLEQARGQIPVHPRCTCGFIPIISS